MADGSHSVLAVPKTVKDTQFVGKIVKALSAESWKTVTPTLCEIALKTRYLRDSESKEIMDIIANGRVFDFGYIYDGWQGFGLVLQNMFLNANNNFESTYSSLYSQARIQYKSMVNAFEKSHDYTFKENYYEKSIKFTFNRPYATFIYDNAFLM